ncbi:MAG: response regulator transcription factor, partial [Opitutaceae bacterium]|nr:response regulator transcription factor [Opitutaceae bacterium]
MARVLVVDDEARLGKLTAEMLALDGHDVARVTGGREALARMAAGPLDVVVTDLRMPDLDGLAVLAAARALPAPPEVVLMTAYGTAESAVAAMKAGAADYVTKPFSITELLARVRAVLRRTSSAVRPSAAESVRIGDIDVDFKLHQARRGKVRIEFTAREFDLLRYFVQHTGQVVTREQILNEVWGYEEFPTTRTIDNFVAKLRQKIERAPHAPEHILTIHGS